MPRHGAYDQGTPSWVELQTSNSDDAKAFYANLFGWTYQDHQISNNPPRYYSEVIHNGGRVCGLYQMPPDMLKGGMPINWATYFDVDDVDLAAKKAKENGATVMVEPTDAGEFGRMAVIADPFGAVFGLWQAGTNPGAEIVNEHGTLIWNELITANIDSAMKFYTAVFETSSSVDDSSGKPYGLLMANDRMVAGVMQQPSIDISPCWSVYFGTDDIAATMQDTTQYGGKVMSDIAETPWGKLAVLQDPQGAVFCVMQPLQAS